MLSRTGSMTGAPAALDRTRVGERLHAALAGLQELQLLRDRQRERVGWALGAHREEPASSVHAPHRGHEEHRGEHRGHEEQRLEATLCALKQQLSRLRKQDVGLKTHLQQLDQQIHELQLDVNKATSDQQENDSRPSSGFYELSDGGSGSLSNSCTSLYSACLSSSPSGVNPHMEAQVQAQAQAQVQAQAQAQARRRSTDESPAHLSAAPRAKGPHLGSSRIRASTEKPRPRPVSTGDLERMMGQTQSYIKHLDTSKPPSPQSAQTSPVDSKFHSNLVSRTGAEVYHYPSPLHAVALQSPIFSPNNEPSSPQRPTGHDDRTLGYIDKILQRSFSRLHLESPSHSLRKPSEVVIAEVSAPPPPTAPRNTNVVAAGQGDDPKRLQEAADHAKPRPRELSHRRLSFHSSDDVSTSTLKKLPAPYPAECSSLSRSHSDYASAPRSERQQRAATCHSSSTEEGHSFEAPQFVHAEFVPAGSQRVKVRQADRKSKNVKLKKPRKQPQQHGYSSKDSSSGKSEQRKSSKAKAAQKAADEHRRGSGSDSSHCSPGVMHTKPKSPPSNAAVDKSGKIRKIPEFEWDQRRRRQMEMYQAQTQSWRAPRGHSMVRSLSCRAAPWQQHFPSPMSASMSASSFHRRLDARYPAAPYHLTRPRCESEYSAECASLFHSTIAASSDGEASDHTANRFGDSESSHSEASSCSEDSSEDEEDEALVWGRHVQQQQPRPAPSACRIKASRALKKKIRRFQPAALKVMTLV